MAADLAPYDAITKAHERRLRRLAGRQAIGGMRKVYDAALGKLQREARRLLKAGMQDSYSAHVNRLLMMQIRDAMGGILVDLGGELGLVAREAVVEGVQSLNKDLSRLEKVYAGIDVVVPTEEAARFAGVLEGVTPSVMRSKDTSMARYGVDLIESMQGKLAETMATGGTTADAIDAIGEAADMVWWRAERIARTEISAAYSDSAREGIIEANKEQPGLMMRWSEHVSDSTWMAMDDRVDDDSLAMHGQVTEAGGVFTMPTNAPKVWKGLLGQTWSAPPNRPNDRAVLQPWRKDWGIPAWTYKGGRKQWLVRR